MKKILKNDLVIIAIKGILCVLLILWLCNCIYIKGFDELFAYKDYQYQNYSSELVAAEGVEFLKQDFVSKGNILSNISLFFGEVCEDMLLISILDEKEHVLCNKTINVAEYNAHSWNTVSMDCDKLQRDHRYYILLSGKNLSYVFLNTGNDNSNFLGTCIIDGSNSPYTLAVKITETYKYMMMGYCLQFIISILFVLTVAVALCFTILNFENIFGAFFHAEEKKGFLYALYFSIYTVLLFNPLDTLRNKVEDFDRVIGVGIKLSVDVTKRTHNFYIWFVCFAMLFSLFFILANYLRNKDFCGENQKVIIFLDNMMIIANLLIGLRCITYFFDSLKESVVFYYSDFIVMAIVLIAISYIVLNLQSRISVEKFELLIVAAWMYMLPVSIAIMHDWNMGRQFVGFQIIVSITIVIIVKFARINWNARWIERSIYCLSISSFLIPFFTSFFIELVIWLNQREIFLVDLRRYYIATVVIGVLAVTVILWICIRVKKIGNWKTFSYPAIVFGFTCLWQQIPISSEYNVHLFETANYSILIGDFLRFRDIPIVQHYGGHMMTGVWEGLLYAILNNDYSGAVFSPYAGYIATLIAVIFFFLIKYIWNEDAAILVTLFFPFYNAVSYWGLGIIIIFAMVAYIKKNTYFRATLFWLSCIWCALYRLDLGFAFIMASIIALVIYIFIYRNLYVIKPLVITLSWWAVLGIVVWCLICVAKDINPINRLIEFLYITLSNKNWAYIDIGNPLLMKYSFAYIFIPFILILAVLKLIFSNKLRDNLGDEKWLMTLILGLSYFCNFSRGLVRHSIVEDALDVCLWSSIIFLSIFVAAVKNNERLFLPFFTMCIIVYSLFQTDRIITENSIANNAVGKVGNYTETWTLSRFSDEEREEGECQETYWAQLSDDIKVIERVKWNKNLEQIIQGYRVVIDALIDEDETFVDFINKTSIYPLLERRNPVYVSQSPLQLSGEFTQEEFVKEMAGVPIILMPYDNENNDLSEGLDGVPNAYRYYKVVEYIYQNYVPLCTYENSYAIWCLLERYEEMSAKIERLKDGIDIADSILSGENLLLHSVELVKNEDGSLKINSSGSDPLICELQNLFDVSSFIGKNVSIVVEYETDVAGPMQIFYTTDLEENYSGVKISTYYAWEKSGTAYFEIPITQYTRIRFDIPEGSSVSIKSFKVGVHNCDLIEYGYDGPYRQESDGYKYLPDIHNYELAMLPILWAEGDLKESIKNEVITDLSHTGELYSFTLNNLSDYGKEGNYLKVCITYNGIDQCGTIESDDETVDATIKVGNYSSGMFDTKYLYEFTVEEGTHEYLFRISNDYYWYTNELNSIKLECSEQLLNIKMQILEGD